MQQKNLWEKLIVSWWWAAQDRWDNVMRLEKKREIIKLNLPPWEFPRNFMPLDFSNNDSALMQESSAAYL